METMVAQHEASDNLWQSSEVLDTVSPECSIDVLAGQLRDLADRAADAPDPKTASQNLKFNELNTLTVSSIGMNVAFNIANYGTSYDPSDGAKAASYAIIAGITVEQVRGLIKSHKSRPAVMHIDDGYSLQCLKLDEKSRTGQPEKLESQVAIAVHPLSYTGGQEESAAHTRQRLTSALEVVAEAQKGSQKLGPVIIPGSVAAKAGLHEGSSNYAAVVEEMTGYPQTTPYKEDEQALVVSPGAVAGIVARLKEGPIRSQQALAELARRFGDSRQSLRLENEGLRTVLLGLLRQAVSMTDGRVYRLEREDLADGRITRTANNTITTIIVQADSYNPILQTAIVGQETAEASNTLRGLTAAETARLLEGEISVDRASDLTLIRLGLEAAEASDLSRLRGDKPSEEEQPVSLATGNRLDIITPLPTSRTMVRLRSMGRIAAGAALFGAAGMAVLGLRSEGELITPEARTEPAFIYKVEDHGLGQRSAYWPTETRYRYSEASGWTEIGNGNDVPQELEVSRRLPDPQTPHATVQIYSRRSNVDMPIQDYTALGAARAVDAAGKDVPLQVLRFPDGELQAAINNPDGDIYRLEYDLVGSSLPVIHVAQPMVIEGSETISAETVAEFGKEDVRQSAEKIRNGFVYDDAPELKSELAATATPGEYVKHLSKAGRCQCDQCNTLVAMVHSRVHPQESLAHVRGYLKPNLKNQGYLGHVGHAWLVSGNDMVDATATRHDAASVMPPVETKADFDNAWTKNRQIMQEEAPRRLPVTWLLSGLTVASLAAAERRYGSLRRMAKNVLGEAVQGAGSESLSRQEALGLLAWHAFGGPTAMPTGEQVERMPLPNIHNIPSDSLREVAAGKFRGADRLDPAQRRMLIRAAKSALFDRRYPTSGRRQRRHGQVLTAESNFDLDQAANTVS